MLLRNNRALAKMAYKPQHQCQKGIRIKLEIYLSLLALWITQFHFLRTRRRTIRVY